MDMNVVKSAWHREKVMHSRPANKLGLRTMILCSDNAAERTHYNLFVKLNLLRFTSRHMTACANMGLP